MNNVRMKFLPYQGWTLTKDKGGKLIQGRTGWLIDEKGYYILQDGRRVSWEILNDEGLDDLRIGNEQPGEGLHEILGARYNEIITKQFDAGDLLHRYGPAMSEVANQALQINRGYVSGRWEPCTRHPVIPPNRKSPVPHYEEAPDCSFKSIGRDETYIPIIVTRVGKENAKYKLVIAGPHGDERNAQRLIMAAQRYFIQHGAPADTVLYFIPCLSPTMCFADARGIPIVNATGEMYINGNSLSSINEAVSKLRSKEHDIPYLHDLIATRQIREMTLRNHIQGQTDPVSPRYGVDANRDYHSKLPSTIVFRNFIDGVKRNCDVSDIRQTCTVIYDSNEEKEEGPFERSTIRHLCFLMIHGYDSRGGVYGPYVMFGKGTAEEWPARMSDKDKEYVDEIRKELGFVPLKPVTINAENSGKNVPVKDRVNDPHLFGGSEYDARPYRGEWSSYLYNKEIWTVDIELPESYDEGRRNDEQSWRQYNWQTVVNPASSLKLLSNDDNPFFNLIENFPWPKKEND
jgi:hypothetical protein